jgi:hypothetical protein
MNVQKKYSTYGDCSCKPWNDSSFSLFNGWMSFDKEKEIIFCPWCGKKLIPFLTKEQCPKRTKEELQKIIDNIDFGEFFGCMKGMKFSVGDNEIICLLRSRDFIGCFQNLQRQYREVWFEFKIADPVEED